MSSSYKVDIEYKLALFSTYNRFTDINGHLTLDDRMELERLLREILKFKRILKLQTLQKN